MALRCHLFRFNAGRTGVRQLYRNRRAAKDMCEATPFTLYITGMTQNFTTLPQGHGSQYYHGVQWDMRDSAWRYITILDHRALTDLRYTAALPLDILRAL